MGVKLTNSLINEFDSINNFFAVEKSDISYNANIASFNYTTLIDYINAILDTGVIYFTPFMELSCGSDETNIPFDAYLLPSFTSDGEYIISSNTNNDQSDSNLLNFLYIDTLFGIVTVGIILFYSKKQSKR